MKTTINIADSLLADLRRLSEQKQMSMRQLMETALRRFLNEEKKSENFRLKKHTCNGRGLVTGISEGDWNEIRRRAYESHGG